MPDSEIVAKVVNSIEADIRSGFAGALESIGFVRDLDGADLVEDDLVATAEQLVVVPWIYRCAHVGEFLGIPPTYIELELRGTTFVRVEGDSEKEWEFYRYIDYLGALHQIGVSTASRPALTADEYAVWVERSRSERPPRNRPSSTAS
jgi:hypothetical protein